MIGASLQPFRVQQDFLIHIRRQVEIDEERCEDSSAMTSRRYTLRDDQWDRIKDLLPGRDGYVGGTAKDNRLFVEAVLYRYRAGIPWRDLPERFGDFRVVHTQH